MNPESHAIPYTLGEIEEATRTRLQLDWMSTAYLLAQLHNTSMNAKKAQSPADYDVYADPTKAGKRRPSFKAQTAAYRSQFLG